MRRLDLHTKKRFRGLKRHIRYFENSMNNLEKMQVERWDGYSYWNHKISIFEKLLSHNLKTTKYILNLYLESAYKCYLNNKQNDQIFTLIISYPGIFASEVCVFFDEGYFQSFQTRNDEYQKWEKQSSGIMELFNLNVPEGCNVINYKETITDEDFIFNGIQTIIKYS